MSPIDLSFLPAQCAQRRFLSQLLSPLLADFAPSVVGISGPLAQTGLARWTPVDLQLLLGEGDDMFDRFSRQVEDLLRRSLDPAPLALVAGTEGCSLGFLRGFVLSDPAEKRAGSKVNDGLAFSMQWASDHHIAALLGRAGPWRILYRTGMLPARTANLLPGVTPQFEAVDRSQVALLLERFWLHMIPLPSLLAQDDHAALATMFAAVREDLVGLIAALNGVRRPLRDREIVRYLGPAQKEALDRTVRLPAVNGASWIGQAVALIVLYRWYAPQLCESLDLTYPAGLEDGMLARFLAGIEDWPAEIQTG